MTTSRGDVDVDSNLVGRFGLGPRSWKRSSCQIDSRESMSGLSQGPELSVPSPLPSSSSGAEAATTMWEHRGEKEVKARDPLLQPSTQTTKSKKKKKQQSDPSHPDDDGSASATAVALPAPVQQGQAPDVPVSSSFAHRRVPRMLACLFSRGQSLVKTESIVPVRKSPRLWGSTGMGDNKPKRRVTFAAPSSAVAAAAATATVSASTHLVIHKPQQPQKQPHGPQRRSKRDKKRGAIALVDEATTAGGEDTCAVVADISSRKSRKSWPHDSPAVPRKADDRFYLAHRGVTPSPASIGGEGGTDDDDDDDDEDDDDDDYDDYGGKSQGSPPMDGIKLLASGKGEESGPTGQDSESGPYGVPSGAAETRATAASSLLCRPQAVHFVSTSCEPTRKQTETSGQSAPDGAGATEVETSTTSAATTTALVEDDVRPPRCSGIAPPSNPNDKYRPAEDPLRSSGASASQGGGRPGGLDQSSINNEAGQHHRVAALHHEPKSQVGTDRRKLPINSKLSPDANGQQRRFVEPLAPKGGFYFDELCEPTGYVFSKRRMPPIRDDFAMYLSAYSARAEQGGGGMLLDDACITIDLPEFREADATTPTAANVVDDPAVHWKYGAAPNRYKELPPKVLLPHHHPFYYHHHHPHDQHDK